jgi:hypothetical protein
MADEERVREVLKQPLDAERLRSMQSAGWRAVAVEWERNLPLDSAQAAAAAEKAARAAEIPFGLQIAANCERLEENPAEMRILLTMMELVVQDTSITLIAEELNRRGYKTRSGADWTALSVYNVFPRLVEVTPRIFSDEAWVSRSTGLRRVHWNS